ncbi:MAG TPA: hypothetical protein VLV86_05720, partial [Vicinamibacterales bacterium]|nr:hypothetical protein [Vicinamibacterales bacterium]
MFELAERIADAVLYEGFLLYPYRASALKNRLRWQFGVLAPRAPHRDGEPSFARTECLVYAGESDPPNGIALQVRVRGLRPAASLSAGEPDRLRLDAVVRSVDLPTIELDRLPVGHSMSLDGLGIDARMTVEATAASD